MGQFRSFGRLSFLVAFLSLIHPLVHGYVVPRTTNSTNSTNTYDNTTSSTGTGSTALTRENFDAIVAKWETANPHLVDKLASGAVETVWQHLSGNGTSPQKKRSTPKPHAPLHKRQNATQSDVDAARKLVAATQAEAGVANAYRLKNPRRNQYINRPTNDTSSKMRARDVSSLVVNSTVASAAALVAEADAALLASNGSLFKDYTLTGKYAKYNQPGFPTGSNLKKRDTYYWLEDYASLYPGTYPFGDDSSYVVYRNVMDYGAAGDGVTDDTAAINAAIADGDRCGDSCGSSSVKNALIYFPSGTYLVSTPIVALYGSQLVGNINDYPTILAAPSFVGLGVISSDVYTADGEYYIDTNNFFRVIRNFVIDMSECTTEAVAGIHWQVAQATSLENILIYMTAGSDSTQVGIFSENGSGGWMADLIFYGGNIGLRGNQQFTTRNLAFLSAQYAIYMLWDWGWTWKSLDIFDCNYGIWFESTDVGGSIYVLDSIFTNTLAAIVIDTPAGSTTSEQILISIDNMVLDDVTDAVIDLYPNVVILAGGSTTIASWVIGKVYDTANPDGTWFTGAPLDSPHPTTGELAGGPQGGYFELARPTYSDTTRDDWISAQVLATGDGVTDDSASLSLMFQIGADIGIGVFVPTGSYIIATPPVAIPINSKIAGACWSQFVAYGDSYNDMTNPVAMITVANSGDLGSIEIQDVLFTVKGPTQGAILVEWNAYQGSQGSVGMWDSHFRIGGALGTDLQAADCPTGSSSDACIAASLGIHVTSGASGYFENMWVWTADHDMDSGTAQTQINIFSGRGVLVESTGPCWFYGTASEHAVLYQYNLAGAENIYLGMIQTESPYYPPFIIAPEPFTSSVGVFAEDPNFEDCNGTFPCSAAWALQIVNSDNIQITGAGLYSWFQDYDEACVDTQNCQQRLTSTMNNGAIYLFNVYTIGSLGMVYDFIETIGIEVTSTLALALAADNTVENAHPYLAAIVAWVEIFPGWGSEDASGTGSSGTSAICTLPDPGTVTAAEASSDRKIAATLNYFLVTTESDNTKYWADNLWTIDGATQDCATPGTDNCVPAATCYAMTSTANYWIENTVSNWNSYMTVFYDAFTTSAFNSSLQVAAIVDAFPINVPDNIPSATAFLNNFGAALGLLGGALGLMEDPALSVVTSVIGGVIADVGSNLADSAGEDDLAAEALINSHISAVLTAVTKSITSSMADLITTGDLSGWPSNIFSGSTYADTDRIAAYFDNGAFFWSPSDANFDKTTLSGNLSVQYNKNLAGMGLNAANWYIMQNSYSLDDCTSISTGTVIGSDCYTLEAPGGGLPTNGGESTHTTYSVPMDSDTLMTLQGFGVDLTDLYTSSWNCQNGNNAYDVVGDFTFNNLDFSLNIPTCFYNLPVFEVSPGTEEDGVFFNTPCQILENNSTATVQTAGISYMPDNLQAVFAENDFCCVWEDSHAICAANL